MMEIPLVANGAFLKAHDLLRQFKLSAADQTNDNTFEMAAPPAEFKSFRYIFLWQSFDLLFLKQVKTRLQQKYTRKIWIHLTKYSSSEVSDRSEVPRMFGKWMF